MLIYDIEIINCIPEKGKPNNSEYTYCKGWHDHSNMGISVIGVYDGEAFFCFSDSLILVANNSMFADKSININLFVDFMKAFRKDTPIGGFNNFNFDDKVIQSVCNLPFESDFDLLQKIRVAAYGSTEWSDQPKGFCYSLDAIAKANGMTKTGHGALAPQQWQDGKYDEVIAYCLNDCRITYDILCLALKGELIDPNTGNKLQIHL